MEQAVEYPTEGVPGAVVRSDSDDDTASSSTCPCAPPAPTTEERAVLQRLYEQHRYTRPWSRRAASSPSAEPPDLPIALSVLYYAAQDERLFGKSQTQSLPASSSPTTAEGSDRAATALASSPVAAERLTHLLEDLSQQRAIARRRAEIHQAKKVEAQRCAVLYTSGLTKLEREAERARAHLARKAEEELAQCTFTPKVSSRAAQLPAKGQESFMEKCLEWEEEARRRTAAKHAHYAEQEREVAVRTSPHMSRGSRRLLEEAAKGVNVLSGGPLETRRELWEVNPARKANEGVDAATGVPVTSTLERRSVATLKQLLQRDPDELSSELSPHSSPQVSANTTATTGDAEAGGDGQHTRSLLLETSPGEKKKTVEAYLTRVAQDQERRADQAERLRKKYEPLLLEPTTGQPFFSPNALPTVETADGRRVPFDELPPEERAAVLERLKRQHAAYALIKYFRQQQSRRGTLVGPGEGRHASIVDRTDVEQARKQRTLDRLRAEQEVDCTFQPKISATSEKMALRKTNGRKIYERPPPSSHREVAERERQARPLHVPTSRADVQRVLDRGDVWQANRERRLEKARQEQFEKETAGCTFTPQRITAHGGGGGGGASGDSTGDVSRAHGTPHEADLHSDAHDGPLGPRNLGRTARRRSSVLSDAAFHGLAVSSDVRLINEVEMLRSHAAVNDPAFLDAVLQAYHARSPATDGETSASLDRSGRRGVVGVNSHSDVYGTPRRPDKTSDHYQQFSPSSALGQGSPKSLRRLLNSLTLRDAPRLPDEALAGWERAYPGDSLEYSVNDDEEDLTTQLQSFSLSPVQAVSSHPHRDHRTAPSLSPTRENMMDALERMHTAQGNSSDGAPTRSTHSTDADFAVQRPAGGRSPLTASSPWPLRRVETESILTSPPADRARRGTQQRQHSSGDSSGDGALTSQLLDPWAALDAQTDAILRRREQNRPSFS